MPLSIAWVCGLAFGLGLVYTISLAAYRLYLSPLSKFPGPKLAALSLWYEFYYDVVRRGQYTFRIAEMHDQYGPIVRINPYEIHINDPEFYDELYTGRGKRRDKWEWSAKQFGIPGSMFSTVPEEHHRIRRAPVSPFFSRQAIIRLEPTIRNLVQSLCDRFDMCKWSGQVVSLEAAFYALSIDTISTYAFAKPFGSLQNPEFGQNWLNLFMALSEMTHINKQFGWLQPIMRGFPDWFTAMVYPELMLLLNHEKMLFKLVQETKETLDVVDTKCARNMFHEFLLDPDLPPEEKELARLVDEATTLIAAGGNTVAWYLKTTMFHILDNPSVLAQMKAELKETIPDSSKIPSLVELEKLPYLDAVVKEGFRLSFGVTHRQQRVAPTETLVYDSYVLPPGTPVSMTSTLLHMNPVNFPEPRKFDPQRWLQPDSKKKEKYLVNFSRGTRSCIGMNLARAEIFLTLATLMRRFDFELFETDRSDVDVAHDFFNPSARLDSRGVRILLK